MGQVNVSVNGRNYTVACDDGQEKHVAELAHYIDGHITELAASVGQVGDARLLLMASLLVSDELSEMVGRIEALEEEIEEMQRANLETTRKANSAEAKVADVLEAAAKQIEDVSARVEATTR